MVRIEIVSDLSDRTFGRSILLGISIVFSSMQIADNVINIHLCRSFWTYLTICILLPALSKIKVFRIIMEEWLSVLASFQHIKKAKNITKVRNCTDITICLFVLFIFFSFCLFVFLSFCILVFSSFCLFDQMSEGSQVSEVTLCVKIQKWQWLTHSPKRVGIELPGQLKHYALNS